jgi:hypothetical protein
MTIYVPGKLTLSRIQQYPAVIGEPWGGGYFAGYISHTADGNPTHALIIAPSETGATGTGYTLTTDLQWKTAATTTGGASSEFDGAANTAAMVTAGIADHPAAEFCVNLSIGGFTDWYLPSLYELDIAYFNLKPSTVANITSVGVNAYSVPKRESNFTTTYPTVTSVEAFSTSSQGFSTASNPFHWCSTETSVLGATRYRPLDGFRDAVGKAVSYRVRAFRRIALP